MRVKVKFFAIYSELVGCRELEMEVEEGTTVASLWEQMKRENPKLGDLSDHWVTAVNMEYVSRDTALADNDEVAFLPPVSGGGIFQITTGEIHPEEVAELVQYDGAGAVVTFSGVVRNESLGKRVLYLEYDAYKEMAEAKMREIGQEIKERWGIERVAIVHRVGHLEIGQASVVIAVATPHRAEAFEACRYAIDRLKETVPIWKKEVWEGGEYWIEGDRPSEAEGENR